MPRVWRSLLVVLTLALLVVRPELSAAQGPDAERLLDGSQAFSLGVDTSRFRVSTGRPVISTEDPALSSAPYRLLDSDLLGTAVSFDLKLQWPASSSPGTSGLGALAPYLSFGPTVLVPGADGVSRPGLSAARSEGPMALGLSWGAGLSWRLSRNAELYGGYRFMQFGRDSLSHGDRLDTELTGHDVMYGISVRF